MAEGPPTTNSPAQELIARHAMIRHPEGGWYRETWRAAAPDGVRAGGSLILFLLESGQRSHWHRVDADELWLWQGGDPVSLAIAPDAQGPVVRTPIGPDAALQVLVPAGHWQAAEPIAGTCGYTLVGCVVVPGFEFAGFALAPPDWAPVEAG